jgi:hypothetical protein
MTTLVIERVLFRTKSGIDAQPFDHHLDALTNLIEIFPGFMHRSIGVSDNGLWMDRVRWKSLP